MGNREELLKIAKLAKQKGEDDVALKALKMVEEMDKVNRPKKIPLLDQVKRQAGLTLRTAAEGVSKTADIFTEPMRYGMNKLGMDIPMSTSGATSHYLNRLGVPNSQTNIEKGVDQAGQFLSGAGGFIRAGQKAGTELGKTIASNPAMQGATAASAGAGGEYAKQQGASPIGQFGASLGAGLAPSGVKAIASKAPNMLPQKDLASELLRTKGIDLKDVRLSVANEIRAKINDALKYGKLDELALKRLVEYAKVNATPTKGTLTLDPVQITKERNLAKAGANSDNANLQQLSRLQSDNNKALINEMNEFTGNIHPEDAGNSILGYLQGKDNAMSNTVAGLYTKARDTSGRALSLDRGAFINRADDLLTESNTTAFLPAEIKSMLNDIAIGKNSKGHETPFTVDTIDMLKTVLARSSRATHDGNVKQAISSVRQALEETPIKGSASQESLTAFDTARKAAREQFTWQEKFKKDLGATPESFVEKRIIAKGVSLDEVRSLVKELEPEQINVIKQQIANTLKSKALSNADDEVGKFSPSRFKGEIERIGDRKLSLFFSAKELDQIKAIKNVASYEHFQPVGSAVNNSNTAGGVVGLLGAANRIAGKLPFGSAAINDPVRNISQGMQGKDALNPSLIAEIERKKQQMGLLPFAYSPNLLD